MEAKTVGGIILVLAVASIGAEAIVNSQFKALTGTTLSNLDEPTRSTFDGDQDRTSGNVNTSWIYFETGDWRIDPSDTSARQVKLEQDGRGLIIIQKEELPYNKTTYYNSASWDRRIQQFESRGFSVVEQPQIVSTNGRKFWSIKLSKTIKGTTAYAYFLATYKDNSQYTFTYSYTPEYAPKDHYSQVLNKLANASLR